MSPTTQPEQQAPLNPFDQEDITSIALSATNYVAYATRHIQPEPGFVASTITDNGDRVTLPVGLLIHDKEYAMDDRGSRVYGDNQKPIEYPVVAGYVDDAHHVHMLDPRLDKDTNGQWHLPAYVTERYNAMSSKTGIQPDQADPWVPLETKNLLLGGIAEANVARQDYEAQREAEAYDANRKQLLAEEERRAVIAKQNADQAERFIKTRAAEIEEQRRQAAFDVLGKMAVAQQPAPTTPQPQLSTPMHSSDTVPRTKPRPAPTRPQHTLASV